MNAFEQKIIEDKIIEDGYKKGILRMLEGNESRFIGIVSNLQELCYEIKTPLQQHMVKQQMIKLFDILDIKYNKNEH